MSDFSRLFHYEVKLYHGLIPSTCAGPLPVSASYDASKIYTPALGHHIV